MLRAKYPIEKRESSIFGITNDFMGWSKHLRMKSPWSKVNIFYILYWKGRNDPSNFLNYPIDSRELLPLLFPLHWPHLLVTGPSQVTAWEKGGIPRRSSSHQSHQHHRCAPHSANSQSLDQGLRLPAGRERAILSSLVTNLTSTLLYP